MLLNNPHQVVIVIIDVLTLIVLTLTLAVVFWYTVVTHRMQKAVVAQGRELVRQRQLSNMPAFVADIKRLDGADYLQLTNIGKGIAINLAIDDVEIRYPTLQPGHIQFDRVLMVPVGDTASIESNFFITSGEAADRNSLTFLGPHAHFDADVNIRFQDIEGANYLQTVRMGKNGYRHGFVKLTDAPSNTAN